MSFSLDIAYVLTEKIGPQGGVARETLMSFISDFSDLHEQFESAADAGVLPHLSPMREKQEDITIFRNIFFEVRKKQSQ